MELTLHILKTNRRVSSEAALLKQGGNFHAVSAVSEFPEVHFMNGI